MVQGLGKEVYFILNKFDAASERATLDCLPQDRVIASIPLDRRVFERGLDGSELDFKLEGVGKIADFLDRMAGTT